ncbi:MAG: hypothetical protein WC554_18740 [Clostridia bacterium]
MRLKDIKDGIDLIDMVDGEMLGNEFVKFNSLLWDSITDSYWIPVWQMFGVRLDRVSFGRDRLLILEELHETNRD